MKSILFLLLVVLVVFISVSSGMFENRVYLIPQLHLTDHETVKYLKQEQIEKIFKSQYNQLKCIKQISEKEKNITLLLEFTEGFFDLEKNKAQVLKAFPDKIIPEMSQVNNEQFEMIIKSGAFVAYSLGYSDNIIYERTLVEVKEIEREFSKLMTENKKEIDTLNAISNKMLIPPGEYLSLVGVCSLNVCSEKLKMEIAQVMSLRENNVIRKIKNELSKNNVITVMGKKHESQLREKIEFSKLPKHCESF